MLLFHFFHKLRAKLTKVASREIGLVLLATLALIIVGATGYAWLEGWSWLDALYATIITITTVGYGDLSPQTPAGRLFAIFFTLTAIGLAGYAISTFAAIVFENMSNRKERKMQNKRLQRITDLEDFYIVCGANVLGQRAANEFKKQQLPFVLIEPDEATLHYALLWMHDSYVSKQLAHYDSLATVDLETEEQLSVIELADKTGVLYLMEDPMDEHVLRRAGIHKAKGLVAALEDDLDNMAVILSARDMANRLGNENMRIVASAQNEANSIHRMYLAGADRVNAPKMSGGFQVATEMLHPVLAEFWEHLMFRSDGITDFARFEDVAVASQPEWVGITVAELNEHHSRLVVAIKRKNEYFYAPNPHECFEADDILIVMRYSSPR